MVEQIPQIPQRRESRTAVWLLSGGIVSAVAAVAIACGPNAQGSPEAKTLIPPPRPDAHLYCDGISNYRDFDLGPNDSTGQERSSTFKVAWPADGPEDSFDIQRVTAQVNTAANIGATSVTIQTGSNIIPFNQIRTPESYGIDFNGLAARISIDDHIQLSLGCSLSAVNTDR